MKNYELRITNYKLFFVSLLAILLFASPVFAGETPELNAGDTAWILTSTALATYGILKAVNAIVALRVCKECEVEGLDVYGHGEQGYIL